MEEEKGVLEEYIKKGLEKGFNIGYIKETLANHGHDKNRIETASNNIIGLKYPEKLKPHLEEVSSKPVKKKSKFWPILAIILLIIVGLFVADFVINRTKVIRVKSQLNEVEELGIDIDELSSTIKLQLNQIKEKDLTIDEKERIIQDQIGLIDEINDKIELQRVKLREIFLDIMNRMIGMISE